MVNFISLNPSQAGTTGLIWLLVSYGFALLSGSNLIADGSELLLLVPSIAELVGSVVLPLLGAVPDGMIMLFSGLGPIKEAQRKLDVGVGAIAGSTIFLLTLNWAACIFAGRVSLIGEQKRPNYSKSPKLIPDLSFKETLFSTGTPMHKQVGYNGVIMLITTVPYLLIQIPAMVFKANNDKDIGGKEKWFAFSGLILCLTGFVTYMWIQVKESTESVAHQQRIEHMLKMIDSGRISLSSAMVQFVKRSMAEQKAREQVSAAGEPLVPTEMSPQIKSMLTAMCKDAFHMYDRDGNGHLDKNEVAVLLMDMNDTYDLSNVDRHFHALDTSGDGTIDFDEFVTFMYEIIKESIQIEKAASGSSSMPTLSPAHSGATEEGTVHDMRSLIGGIANRSSRNVTEADGDEEDEDEDEIPEKFEHMTVKEQQRAIKLQSFFMLTLGTGLVIIFSDPMVGVFTEIAKRTGIPAFYVSFVLAPLASNASEMISSYYYAKKKTSKTIAVSFKQLVGAAIMNNTFCLSIFMALTFFRGLTWNFTAETLSIILIQIFMFLFTRKNNNTFFDAILIALLFPLSLVIVAVMKKAGLT